MRRADVIDSAREIVVNGRNKVHGEPENSFRRIAELWSTFRGEKFTSSDVCMMMALLKIARISYNVETEDSYVDAIGYIACAAEESSRGTSIIEPDYEEMLTEKVNKYYEEADEVDIDNCDYFSELLLDDYELDKEEYNYSAIEEELNELNALNEFNELCEDNSGELHTKLENDYNTLVEEYSILINELNELKEFDEDVPDELYYKILDTYKAMLGVNRAMLGAR